MTNQARVSGAAGRTETGYLDIEHASKTQIQDASNEARRKGGENSQASGRGHQLTQEDRRKGGVHSQASGRGHQLTQEDRRKGGANSHSRRST